MEYQPKMKNWIYHHSTGLLIYASVLSMGWGESDMDSYNLGPSPPSIALKYFAALCTTIPISKLTDRIRKLFHEK